MSGWVLFWLAGVVVAWPLTLRCVRHFRLKEFPELPWDAMDSLMATTLATIAALAWPISWPVAALAYCVHLAFAEEVS